MNDKITEALVQALKQALSSPFEQRLFRSGKLDGLFPSRSGTNADAAAQAVREGLLEVVRTEERGKSTIDWVRIAPDGVDFLHRHESPLHALNELRETLRTNEAALPVWLDEMRQNLARARQQIEDDARVWQHQLGALSRRVEEGLKRLEREVPVLPNELIERYPWATGAMTYLERRDDMDSTKLCPMPELFAAVRRDDENIRLSDFHEGLCRLQVQRAVRLLPMGEGEGIPQPEYALFDGASVYYLVSRAA